MVVFSGFTSTLAQTDSAAAAALIVVVVGRAVVVDRAVVAVAEIVVAELVALGTGCACGLPFRPPGQLK